MSSNANVSRETPIDLSGLDAIAAAERDGRTLSKYADPTEGHRDGLTVDEARAIAKEDPSLVYLSAEEQAEAEEEAREAAKLAPRSPCCEAPIVTIKVRTMCDDLETIRSCEKCARPIR